MKQLGFCCIFCLILLISACGRDGEKPAEERPTEVPDQYCPPPARLELPRPAHAVMRYFAYLLQGAGAKKVTISPLDPFGLKLVAGVPDMKGLDARMVKLAKDLDAGKVDGRFPAKVVDEAWEWDWTTVVAYGKEMLEKRLKAEGKGDWMPKIIERTEAYLTREIDVSKAIDHVAKFFGVKPEEIGKDRIVKALVRADKEAIDAMIGDPKKPWDFVVLNFVGDILKHRVAWKTEWHTELIGRFTMATEVIGPYLTDLVKAFDPKKTKLDFITVRKREKVTRYNPETNKLETVTVKCIDDLDLLNGFLNGGRFYARFIPEVPKERKFVDPDFPKLIEDDFIEADGKAYESALFNLQIFIKALAIALPRLDKHYGRKIDIYSKKDMGMITTDYLNKIVDEVWETAKKIPVPAFPEVRRLEKHPDVVRLIQDTVDKYLPFSAARIRVCAGVLSGWGST